MMGMKTAMVDFRFLLLECFLLYSVIQFQGCSAEQCGPNEEYSFCSNKCDKCVDRDGSCFQIAACTPGCQCKEGYFRNSQGRCVLEVFCDGRCGPNEVYLECGSTCPDTCENYGKPRPCSYLCVPGCFCKKGFVKNQYGRCIRPEMCKNRLCRKDEVYLECGPGCPATCENYGKGIPCDKSCAPGCFCKEGFVRDSDGRCIIPERCIKECGPNEEYSTCVVPCNGCEIKGKCNFLVCNKGCDCIKGYYRNKQGICIPESLCPNTGCGLNEEYSHCVVPCNDCKIKGKCNFLKCNEGCDCKKGYYRNNNGICIAESLCPVEEKCGLNEEYNVCGTACPETCANMGQPRPCTKECVPGCFCKKRLVRNDSGKCVLPAQCESKQGNCKKDEAYLECGSSCPDTCENYGKPRFCTLQCVQGCFCKRGLVRNNSSNCVTPEKCDKKICNNDEVFKDCGSACPDTCDNYEDESRPCTRNCVRGCFCRDGLVRNLDTMQCIRPEKCEERICGVNEEYKSCGTACQATCANRGQTGACTKQCVEGCFCKEGLVRNSAGHCVLPSQCPPQQGTCGKDEEFVECVPCGNTCETYKIRQVCRPICKPGCTCKGDLVKRKDGKCVKIENCFNDTVCGVNEVFKSCGSICQPKCPNSLVRETFVCTKQCVEGCFCKEGLVRNGAGHCIPPSQCPPQQGVCGKDEEFVECVPCGNTCETYEQRLYCKQACRPGCTCKEGLVKRKDGQCVKPESCFNYPGIQCSIPRCTSECPLNYDTKPCPSCSCKPNVPGHCRANEEYKECGTACQPTCNEPHPYCSFKCTKGCFCQKGFIRSEKDGPCVPEESCGKTVLPACNKNEKYYEGCMPLCRGSCETYDKNILCKIKCTPGCFCDEGFVKRKDGECVRPSRCNETVNAHQCKDDEQFYGCIPECRNTCETYGKQDIICPDICREGCFCKPGLVKATDGRCVQPKECKPVAGCSEEEVEYEDYDENYQEEF